MFARIVRRFGLPLAILLASASGVLVISPAATAADGANIISLTDCTNQMLSQGSRSDCVLSLQHSLTAVGITVTEDGIFGPQTEAAVRGFQSSQPGLAVDGIAGPQTITRLDFVANSPQALPPAGGSTVSGPSPEGTVYTNGVINSTVGSTAEYFSRSYTRIINDKLNTPNNQAIGGGISWAACKAITTTAPEVSVPCDMLMLAGNLLVSRTLKDAVDSNACFEVKFHNYGALFGTVPEVLTNNGRNCIN